MSTNARIGLEILPGERVESIYTHWDGYPSHHGTLLLGHWNSREKVRELLALGDLSVLGKQVGQAHPFDAPYDDPLSGFSSERWSWRLFYSMPLDTPWSLLSPDAGPLRILGMKRWGLNIRRLRGDSGGFLFSICSMASDPPAERLDWAVK